MITATSRAALNSNAAASFLLVAEEKLSSTGLLDVIADERGETEYQCYLVDVYSDPDGQPHSEAAQMVFAEGRAGISWGADPQWTDAATPEEAIQRWLDGELVN